jgi:hypothetical protein
MALVMTKRYSSESKLENDRLLALERENARLQRLVAELLIKNQMLRDTLCREESDVESGYTLLPNLLMF